MRRDITKKEIVLSTFTLIWIFLVNIITPLITSVPAWPMFFVTITFALTNGDIKKLPSIFCSGATGIILTYILYLLLGVLEANLGLSGAMAVLIFIALTLIIVGGNWFPMFLNNITFAYLTICTIDLGIVGDQFAGWMVMFLVGGVVIVSGVIGIAVFVEKIFAKKGELNVGITAAAKEI